MIPARSTKFERFIMACEKCWGDAYLRWMSNPEKSQAEHYRDLLEERKNTPCTVEEQQGLTMQDKDSDD